MENFIFCSVHVFKYVYVPMLIISLILLGFSKTAQIYDSNNFEIKESFFESTCT